MNIDTQLWMFKNDYGRHFGGRNHFHQRSIASKMDKIRIPEVVAAEFIALFLQIKHTSSGLKMA